MKDIKLRFEPILEQELYTTPPLMTVIVAKLKGTKRDIPKAFRLTSALAKDDLRHLRRLRHLPGETLECIISKSMHSKASVEELEEIRKRFELEDIFTEYRFTQVPSKGPRTEQQLEACSAIWPCKFAKCTHLVKCIDGSLLTDSETLVLKLIGERIIQELHTSKATSIAVIFRCSRVYGVGLSNKSSVDVDPIQHSTMLAIDSVAYNYNSSHWKNSSGDYLMNSIQSQLDEQELLKDHTLDDNFLPYLCTDFDIFVTEEPCFMCTMGLVQSRIRRLFYLDNKKRLIDHQDNLCYPDSAIETHLVHRHKNLNHRFEAWRVAVDVHESLEETSNTCKEQKNKIIDVC